MKKPKFNQLRGTYAHSLRHRICLGIAVGFTVVTAVCSFALYKLVPEPFQKKQEFLEYFRINPLKNSPVFDVRVEHPD